MGKKNCQSLILYVVELAVRKKQIPWHTTNRGICLQSLKELIVMQVCEKENKQISIF